MSIFTKSSYKALNGKIYELPMGVSVRKHRSGRTRVTAILNGTIETFDTRAYFNDDHAVQHAMNLVVDEVVRGDRLPNSPTGKKRLDFKPSTVVVQGVVHLKPTKDKGGHRISALAPDIKEDKYVLHQWYCPSDSSPRYVKNMVNEAIAYRKQKIERYRIEFGKRFKTIVRKIKDVDGNPVT